MKATRALSLVAFLALTISWTTTPAIACAEIMVPGDFGTIGEAIAAASRCDQVHVSAGIYRENVFMKAGVDLIGAGTEVTAIAALDVVVTGADDALIQGFTISGGNVGIRADGVLGFSVVGNVVTKLRNPNLWGGVEGIDIANSTDVFLCGNRVSQVRDTHWNRAVGIQLSGNSGLIVHGNTVSDVVDTDWDYACGICDEGSDGSKIVGNLVFSITDDEWDSCYGIYETGDSAEVSYNTIVYITDGKWDDAYGIRSTGVGATISNNIVAHVSEESWGIAYGICCTGEPSAVAHNDVWSVSETGAWPGPGVPYCGPIGAGNLMVDPLFQNVDEGDFRLRPDSPLLKASESGGEIGAYGAPCLCLCDDPVNQKPVPLHGLPGS